MKIGIWIDRQQAHIISIIGDKTELKTIFSSIDDFHVNGGSGTRLKGGPQDVVHDSKYLMREKQQFKNYFDEIIIALEKVTDIVIFGPAEAGKKFQKYLFDRHNNISKKLKGLIKADSMTPNQMKQWVKKYYSKTYHSN